MKVELLDDVLIVFGSPDAAIVPVRVNDVDAVLIVIGHVQCCGDYWRVGDVIDLEKIEAAPCPERYR